MRQQKREPPLGINYANVPVSLLDCIVRSLSFFRLLCIPNFDWSYSPLGARSALFFADARARGGRKKPDFAALPFSVHSSPGTSAALITCFFLFFFVHPENCKDETGTGLINARDLTVYMHERSASRKKKTLSYSKLFPSVINGPQRPENIQLRVFIGGKNHRSDRLVIYIL